MTWASAPEALSGERMRLLPQAVSVVPKEPQKRSGLQPLQQFSNGHSFTARGKTRFVSGHDFSRATTPIKKTNVILSEAPPQTLPARNAPPRRAVEEPGLSKPPQGGASNGTCGCSSSIVKAILSPPGSILKSKRTPCQEDLFKRAQLHSLRKNKVRIRARLQSCRKARKEKWASAPARRFRRGTV